MKIAIEKEKWKHHGIAWTACKPFVENKLGVLIHRPRHVTTHKISDRWKSHISIHCWCGMVQTGTKKFTFLDTPLHDSIVCGRCEDAAVAAGLPSSESLSGRHVHTGGVIAVRRCCDTAIAKVEGQS